MLRTTFAVEQDLERVGIIRGASIYPFASLAIAREPEIQALPGIPPHIAVCAVMPLGRRQIALSALRRSRSAGASESHSL